MTRSQSSMSRQQRGRKGERRLVDDDDDDDFPDEETTSERSAFSDDVVIPDASDSAHLLRPSSAVGRHAISTSIPSAPNRRAKQLSPPTPTAAAELCLQIRPAQSKSELEDGTNEPGVDEHRPTTPSIKVISTTISASASGPESASRPGSGPVHATAPGEVFSTAPLIVRSSIELGQPGVAGHGAVEEQRCELDGQQHAIHDPHGSSVPARGAGTFQDGRTGLAGPLVASSSRYYPRRGTRLGGGRYPQISWAQGSLPGNKWNHDMHQAHEMTTATVSHGRASDPPRMGCGSVDIPKCEESKEPINRHMSTEQALGQVSIVVKLPGIGPLTLEPPLVIKQYTMLPDHRPPLRRDKPARIFLHGMSVAKHIYPATDRSFIFIPRAMRPNQQRNRGKMRSVLGSMGGISRRTSMFGGASIYNGSSMYGSLYGNSAYGGSGYAGSVYAGSVFSPSAAVSRRSSFAVNPEGMLSPPGSTTVARPTFPHDVARQPSTARMSLPTRQHYLGQPQGYGHGPPHAHPHPPPHPHQHSHQHPHQHPPPPAMQPSRHLGPGLLAPQPWDDRSGQAPPPQPGCLRGEPQDASAFAASAQHYSQAFHHQVPISASYESSRQSSFASMGTPLSQIPEKSGDPFHVGYGQGSGSNFYHHCQAAPPPQPQGQPQPQPPPPPHPHPHPQPHMAPQMPTPGHQHPPVPPVPPPPPPPPPPPHPNHPHPYNAAPQSVYNYPSAGCHGPPPQVPGPYPAASQQQGHPGPPSTYVPDSQLQNTEPSTQTAPGSNTVGMAVNGMVFYTDASQMPPPMPPYPEYQGPFYPPPSAGLVNMAGSHAGVEAAPDHYYYQQQSQTPAYYQQ